MQLSKPRRGARTPRCGARKTSVAAVACVALSVTGCAAGSEQVSDATTIPEDVTVVVPFGTGGGTDTWARFMAPYLEETIGRASLSLENVPGGEGIPGTNEYVRESQDDGSTVLMATASTYFQNLLGRQEAEYDFSKLKPLVVSGTGGVLYASAESGIQTPEDLLTNSTDLHYGGSSTTGLDVTVLLLFEIFGLDVESTFGFESRGDIRLALQRGELNLDFQTTPAYLTQVQPLVDEGKAVPLMSFGVLDESGNVVRDPNMPDLPTPGEVYENINGEPPSGPAWEAYRAFHTAGFAHQKGLWTTPETHEQILGAYHDAATSLEENADFQAEAEEVLGGYPLYAGDAVEQALRDAFEIGDVERDFVRELLAEKYDTVIE